MRLTPLALLTLAALSQTLPTPMYGQGSGKASDPTLPVGAHAILTAQGQGYQVYACTRQGTDYQWTLTGPMAKLLDPDTLVELGKHTIGPTWTWKDGSTLHGKPLHTYQPDPGSIPWLLLAATPDPATPGALAHVTQIRRSNTQGGLAPKEPCDAAHATATTPVPYTAIYTFYEGQE